MLDKPNELQLAGFRLDGLLFAIDLMRIKEIVLPQKLSGLPDAASAIDGMINLRGTIIPVLNLRTRLDLPPMTTGSGKLIIVALADKQMALLVDEVEDVITVKTGDLAPPPEVSGCRKECLLAVCLHDEELYMILDIDAITAHYF